MASALAHNDSGDELWRKCALWLTQWEMLRPDHKANWPESTIADLANILRDGVLLCKLLNKIEPGCIDMKDVNLKPTMAQFLCLRNIQLFLKTCIEHFGLKQSDLFQDSMLFDLTNFHKVLCTLSKLSLSPKALESNIPGFTAQNANTEEEDVIFQRLKSVNRSGVVDPEYDRKCDEIYQDLCAIRIAEHPPTFEKRDFVIKELLDTEKNYVDVLGKLQKHFMIPLASCMKQTDHQVVFHKIKELHEIHCTFYNELLKVIVDSQTKLSSVFMRWREKFLTYGLYCANLTKATNLLQELCDTNESFNAAVTKHEKGVNNGRFKLRDVLSVPMQRILKYHLLLEKLIENTDPNHDEYNDLRRARESMLDVAGYINEAARDSEHLAVINKLQETIVEWQPGPNMKLSDYGRLIKDAELRIKAHDDQKTKSRYVFIFDKCILVCKQAKGNQFAYRDILNISDYHTDEMHNRPILNKEARFVFSFYLVKNDNNTAYTISVKTLEIKEQIIKAINDALDNLHPKALQRTTHNFELNTFPQAVTCFYCSKYLKGLFYQGYKCSTCLTSVHKSCIQFSGKCGASPGHLSGNILNGSINGKPDNPLLTKLWFAGEMDRNTAQDKLNNREHGTFLVRIRPQCNEKDKYALSLKTNIVRHMKIFCKTDSYRKRYFLSPYRCFHSIEELVLNYQENSLQDIFDKLEENTRLLWPYRQLVATALRNFDAHDIHQLGLVEGETLTIVGTEGYRNDWWKGRNENNETGYFPASKVKVEGEIRFDE